MEKYIGVKPSERKPSPKPDRTSIMGSFEEQVQNRPSYMFQSTTQRGSMADQEALNRPGPQDYSASVEHLLKKDFSRPRFVSTQPTRNLDGALRTQPFIASNEIKHKMMSPGPVRPLESPKNAKER